MTEIVVFDMDGTLLSNDSTKQWIKEALKDNVFRLSGAIFIMPIAIPLMKIKKYKSIGASLFLWLATVGLSDTELQESFIKFSEKIKAKSYDDLYWFMDGIQEMDKHIENGKKVIIVTAAPEILATVLVKSIGMNVNIIGTPLKKKIGGWIGGEHCRHKEKVRRLELQGIKGPWFATYSDDIEDDYPILINSKNPYLINSDNKKIDNKLTNVIKLKWI
ncbi:haloacid dehalogenase-like hydrolase [Acinetobacter calcoaceticus]|uniref:haloacid dehalogenase-like hydrolase n=1 Tax=Acinetobacter calcoaceticus TaxID=471 RepID=UPI0030080982